MRRRMSWVAGLRRATHKDAMLVMSSAAVEEEIHDFRMGFSLGVAQGYNVYGRWPNCGRAVAG